MIYLISLAAYLAATAFACSMFDMSVAKWIIETVVAIIIVSIPIGLLCKAPETPWGRALLLGPINVINSNNRLWALWAAILVVSICHTLSRGVVGEIPYYDTMLEERLAFETDSSVQNARREIDELYQELYDDSPTGKVVTWATKAHEPKPTDRVEEPRSWQPLLFTLYCLLVWLSMIILTFSDEVEAGVNRARAAIGQDTGGRATTRGPRQSWFGRARSSTTNVATAAPPPTPAAAAATHSNSASSVFRDSLIANIIVEIPEIVLSILRAMRHANN